MRIGTAMSTAALAVSVAALVLVIMLFITERQDSREPDAEHSQELTEAMLQIILENHANAQIKANGITDENIETMSTIPG
jgi:outer membrane biosynthesis protein TonB